jgi:hypothetical protein
VFCFKVTLDEGSWDLNLQAMDKKQDHLTSVNDVEICTITYAP